jgi:fatty acid amide hydrolase 2
MKQPPPWRAASELSRAVAEGRRTVVQGVEAAIERIERYNPALNGLVADRYERARSEARAWDARIALFPLPDDDPSLLPLRDTATAPTDDDHPVAPSAPAPLDPPDALLARWPLLGVPFVTRESLAMQGCPHTAGLVARTGEVASEDSTVVTRLRDAGAIPLGVTNPAELGLWLEADNLVYGRTSNPHQPARTAGGDGGGDAALVAAGCVPFAIGTDLNGGNRVPAAFCGVVGMKPSGGMVPSTGLYPDYFGRMRWYNTTGPIAASATDLDTILRVIAGPDGHDPTVEPYLLRDPGAVEFLWKRVLVCPDPGFPGLRPRSEVVRAVERAAELLVAGGAEKERWRPEQFPRAAEIWLAMYHEAWGISHTFEEILGGGQRISVLRERARGLVGLSRHTPAALAMVMWERATKNVYVQIQKLSAEGRRLRERLNLLLADGGVLLLPVYPTTAPKHGGTRSRPTAVGYAAIFNVLGLPAVSVPMGTGRGGLPLAVQVVAAQGRDDVCIAAAVALEKHLRGRPQPRMRRLAPDDR